MNKQLLKTWKLKDIENVLWIKGSYIFKHNNKLISLQSEEHQIACKVFPLQTFFLYKSIDSLKNKWSLRNDLKLLVSYLECPPTSARLTERQHKYSKHLSSSWLFVWYWNNGTNEHKALISLSLMNKHSFYIQRILVSQVNARRGNIKYSV